MSTQTVSIFDKALKDIYIGPIRDQLNRSSVVHDMIRKDSDAILGGRRARIPVVTRGNAGTGSRGETDDLPTAGTQTIDEAVVPLKYHFGRIQISDAVMEASRTDRMAFKNAFTVETEGLIKDLKDNIGRQTFNDGTPTIALVATTVGVDNTVAYDEARHRNPFRNDQIIDIVKADQTGPKVADSRTISAVVPTSDTAGDFTIDGAAVADTDGDRIVLEDSMVPAATPTYHEFNGLNGAIGGDGAFGLTTYLGLDGSAETIWQSQIVAGGSADLVDEILQESCDLVERESGEMTDCFVTTYGVRKIYLTTLEADKRFMDLKLTGGWQAVAFASGSGQMPIYVDKWCTPQTAYGLTKKFWAVYRMADFGWLDKDGAVLSRVSNKPVYEATLRYYAELGCTKRNAQSRINALNES